MSLRIVYQLFGTSSCVSTRTTPGTASAADTSTVMRAWWRSDRCILQVQQPGRVDVLEELRAAGDVAERVEPLDGGADDLHRSAPAASRIALMMLS